MRCHCCDNETHDLDFCDSFLNNELQMCNYCKHIQLKVLPSPYDLFKYYNGEYAEKRNNFIGSAYFDIMEKRGQAQFSLIKRYIQSPIKSAIDIGCGYGFLMDVFNKNKTSIYGIEFDIHAAEFCKKKGLDVIIIENEKDIKNILKPVQLVTMSHVLEHLVDFDETLELIRKASDYLFIEVPAYNNINELYDDQEGHIQFFNRDSLYQLLKKRGFNVINFDTYGPSLSFFYLKKFKKIRSFFHIFTDNYFFNLYEKPSKDGIWIRAVVESIR